MTSHCRACGRGNLVSFLRLPDMPLVGSFSALQQHALDTEKYPLSWSFCTECGIAQVDSPINNSIIFNDNYSFSTGTVPSLVSHFRALARDLNLRLAPESLLEFGSNDGTFLSFAREQGIRVVGVDPSDNVNDIARSKGLSVYTEFLNAEAAQSIAVREGQFDIIVGCNCFAHNDTEHPTLEGVQALLKPGGVLCIEVMYALDTINKLQWDGLYHEHVFLYSLHALIKLLSSHDLYVFDAERIPVHAGSLRIFASHGRERDRTDRMVALLAAEASAGLHDQRAWLAFGARSTRAIDIARDIVGQASRQMKFWGYGASGRAAMWANACHLANFDAVIDASPLRYGRFLPGVGTPIISPEAAQARGNPHVIFIYAWNYREDIVKQASFYRGVWATPAPELAFF